MKKTMTKLLPLVLVVALLVSGCGEYTEGVRNSNGPIIVTDPSGGTVVVENPFTVQLTMDGEPFRTSAENPVTVQWNDGYSLHTAQADPETGLAVIGGLDGDYRITLTGLPDGYVFNPNIYNASNDNPHVEISIMKVIPTVGTGIDRWNCIEIDKTGIYCVEVKEADRDTFFSFAPKENGVYTVESWMDTVQDTIDPNADYYGANFAYKELVSSHDDGGYEGTYTKNFKMDVQIADENISKNDTGSVVFTFAVSATQKNGEYPIKVYISITYNGGYSLPGKDAQMIVPTQDLANTELPVETGTFRWAEAATGGTYFSYKSFELNPNDGYYHVFDPVKYASSGGWGPILYAMIKEPTRFLEGQTGPSSFTQIEYSGNNALTVAQQTKNYKLFIEGFDYLCSMGADPVFGKQPYFCDRYCPCRIAETCDSKELGYMNGACTPECEECLSTCNRCPVEGMGNPGYGPSCNSDGCYPVTAELKTFLQEFSVSQLLFMDGQGFAETHPQYSIFADEESQWLFACGYYE